MIYYVETTIYKMNPKKEHFLNGDFLVLILCPTLKRVKTAKASLCETP